jgi:hypothetical protein
MSFRIVTGDSIAGAGASHGAEAWRVIAPAGDVSDERTGSERDDIRTPSFCEAAE